MGTRRLIDLPDFNAVAAGGRPTLGVPEAGMYHAIILDTSTTQAGGATRANMESGLTEFKVKLNGKDQRIFSAAELFKLNDYYGIPFEDGKVKIYFSPYWARSPGGEDGLGWPIDGSISSFQIEVAIAGTYTAPTLEATAVWEPLPVVKGKPIVMGPIVKWDRFTLPIVGAGKFNWTGLPKEDRVYGLHLFSPDFDLIEVSLDKRDFVDVGRSKLHSYYADQGRVPQADMTHIDFWSGGRVTDNLPVIEDGGRAVKDARFEFTALIGAVGNVTMLVESVGQRNTSGIPR